MTEVGESRDFFGFALFMLCDWLKNSDNTLDQLEVKLTGAIYSIRISRNFCPKLIGLVQYNRKRFGKEDPPFEEGHFFRLDRSHRKLPVPSIKFPLQSPLCRLFWSKAKLEFVQPDCQRFGKVLAAFHLPLHNFGNPVPEPSRCHA